MVLCLIRSCCGDELSDSADVEAGCRVVLAVWGVSLCAEISVNAEEIAKGRVFSDTNGNGKLDRGESGLAGVGVSNGRNVVQTKQDGSYEIPVDADSIVFVIKPTGFSTPADEDHLSKFYYIHKPEGSPKDLKFPGVPPTGQLPAQIDFPLTKTTEASAFNVIFFGDPQPRDQKEIDFIAHDVVEGLIGSDAAFGVTLGDILFDDLSLFKSLNRTVARSASRGTTSLAITILTSHRIPTNSVMRPLSWSTVPHITRSIMGAFTFS